MVVDRKSIPKKWWIHVWHIMFNGILASSSLVSINARHGRWQQSAFYHRKQSKMIRRLRSFSNTSTFWQNPQTMPAQFRHDHLQKTALFSSEGTDFNQFSESAIELISSTKGATVKLFSSILSKKKARVQHQLTVVEGHRLVLDLLKNNTTRFLIRHILVTQQALETTELGPELRNEIGALLSVRDGSLKVNLVTEQVMKLCTDTITPQGVVAMCSIPPEWEATTPENENSLYLVLDGVSDPGNVGTLMRSSLAVNVKAVLLLPGCVDVYSPKAVRSAMGGTFRVPIRTMESPEQCWSYLRQFCGVDMKRIFAATMDNGDSSDSPSPAHCDIDWQSGPSALCIGKEGQGLSPEVREAVLNGRISSLHVPMANGVESLNAAVCGSVIMFEYARQAAKIIGNS